MLPPEFDEEVYALVRQIPPGCVVTYGQIARLGGWPNQARRVGRALSAAPEDVPCHRVTGCGGRLVPGWSAQRTLLAQEGVTFRPNGCADLRRHGWEILETGFQHEALVGAQRE